LRQAFGQRASVFVITVENFGGFFESNQTGSGHVVLFSNNPVYRGETQGSYSLVLNTILNFDSLDAGRKLAEK
jgi:hypothetical protein